MVKATAAAVGHVRKRAFGDRGQAHYQTGRLMVGIEPVKPRFRQSIPHPPLFFPSAGMPRRRRMRRWYGDFLRVFRNQLLTAP
jgi:hypothetical protein